MSASPLRADDFPDFGAAADHALEAAMIAYDVALVVSLALATDCGTLTATSQDALRTVARYGVDKAAEARNAIDRAGGLFRTSRGGR